MSEYRRCFIRRVVENFFWRQLRKPTRFEVTYQPDDVRNMVMEIRTESGWKAVPIAKD